MTVILKKLAVRIGHLCVLGRNEMMLEKFFIEKWIREIEEKGPYMCDAHPQHIENENSRKV